MLQEYTRSSDTLKQNKTYTFVSHPRAIIEHTVRTHKLGDQLAHNAPIGNLMNDRRVIRGNTYSRYATGRINQKIDFAKIDTKRTRQVKYKARKSRNKDEVPKSPNHESGTTSIEDSIAKTSVECQTDFDSHGLSSSFASSTNAIDVATQIYDDDFYDFETDISYIADALVTRTTERALLEVMQEEEANSSMAQRDRLTKLQKLGVPQPEDMQRYKDRYIYEKMKEKSDERMLLDFEVEHSRKKAVHAFSHAFLTELAPTVFKNLEKNCYINDPVAVDIEEGFIPWLMDRVTKNLDSVNDKYAVELTKNDSDPSLVHSLKNTNDETDLDSNLTLSDDNEITNSIEECEAV